MNLLLNYIKVHRDGAEMRALFSTAVAWVPFPDIVSGGLSVLLFLIFLVISVPVNSPVSLTS